MGLGGRTVIITGATRGIGLAIALRAARDGANVAILGKTGEAHPRLPGTVHTAARAVEEAGGRALPLVTDVRDEGQVLEAVRRTVETFGGVDALVNNASAINLSPILQTDMKRFDLMHQVNARGTFLCAKACLPHLVLSPNPHILTLCPPPSLDPALYAPHLAYALSKMGMSLVTLGLAEAFRASGVAVNGLWPLTTIDTAAVRMLGGSPMAQASRRPEIMADAAHAILVRPARACTGRFFVDEAVLREEGVTDFSGYQDHPGGPLLEDLFLPRDVREATPTPLQALAP